MTGTSQDAAERRKHWRDAALWIVGIPLFFFAIFVVKELVAGPKTIGDFAKQEEERCLERIAREGWHPGPVNRKLTPEIHCAIKGHLKAREMACDQWDEACY